MGEVILAATAAEPARVRTRRATQQAVLLPAEAPPRHRKLVMEARRCLELAQTRAISRSLRWPPKDLTT